MSKNTDDEYDDGYPKEEFLPRHSFDDEEEWLEDDHIFRRYEYAEQKATFWRTWAIGFGMCAAILLVMILLILAIIDNL